MFNVDLTNCDREPIHIPGKIQGHGFLIAVDEEFKIAYCSENIFSFLKVSAVSLLAQPVEILDTYFDKADLQGFIAQLIKLRTTSRGFEPANPYHVDVEGEPYNLIISQSGSYHLLDFEPDLSDLKSDLQRTIGSSLSEMLSDAKLFHLLNKSASQIKKIIGYDRVMIYRFHDDGHGEVVSEVKNDELESLLGLHYPASDIPKQARELYKINLIRLISNVNTETSGILTLDTAGATSLDLTHSVLRAVSPIHIQYLQNMGVASSFSISIIHRGELWGLVACHNYTPRFINYKEREAAKLIGQVLSSALGFRQHEEDQLKTDRLKVVVDNLTKHLLRNTSVEDSLFNHFVTLQDAVESTGSALFYDHHLHTSGNVPDEKFLKELVDWLSDNMEEELYITDRLPIEYPAALAYKDCASGIMVCRLSRELKEYIIWFRPEIITEVRWAGNPDKGTVNEQGVIQISPRKSFEVWAETVLHTSTAWSQEDIISAGKLKEEVTFAISRKATEIRMLNEKIKFAYDELDAFSYTISHDLKNPLTSIISYSQLLIRNFILEPKAKFMVERILSSADKMKEMIHNVLHYSKVGQADAIPKLVQMDGLLADLKEELLIANEHSKVQIVISDTPNVYGDETMVMQVFSNLLGNAVKYSKNSNAPLVTITGEDMGLTIQYAITDNGIGIKPADHGKIFELFTRSEDVLEYEGSGVGLSIVKKIMEKHRGRIWVDSEVNKGSAFYVSFNKQ